MEMEEDKPTATLERKRDKTEGRGRRKSKRGQGKKENFDKECQECAGVQRCRERLAVRPEHVSNSALGHSYLIGLESCT